MPRKMVRRGLWSIYSKANAVQPEKYSFFNNSMTLGTCLLIDGPSMSPKCLIKYKIIILGWIPKLFDFSRYQRSSQAFTLVLRGIRNSKMVVARFGSFFGISLFGTGQQKRNNNWQRSTNHFYSGYMVLNANKMVVRVLRSEKCSFFQRFDDFVDMPSMTLSPSMSTKGLIKFKKKNPFVIK